MKKGVFIKSRDPELSRIAAVAGLDFLILDREHGILSLSDIRAFNFAAGTELKTFVRLKNIDDSEIRQIVELGVSGLMVPNVKAYSDYVNLKENIFFYPKGKRGICCYVPAANYGAISRADYLGVESNQVELIVQIEGIEVLKELESFINDDDISVLFIGPYDLSQSLGIPGQIENKIVVEKIKEIVNECSNNGMSVGLYVDNVEGIPFWSALGVEFFAVGVDYNIILNGFKIIASI